MSSSAGERRATDNEDVEDAFPVGAEQRVNTSGAFHSRYWWSRQQRLSSQT